MLQNITKAPLGENAFAGRDGQVGAPRDFRHAANVLTLNRLFDEPGIERFEFLDEQFCVLGGDGAVKIDADVAIVTDDFP